MLVPLIVISVGYDNFIISNGRKMRITKLNIRDKFSGRFIEKLLLN